MHNLAAFQPRVKLNGQGIEVAKYVSFTGVVFDPKMAWKPYVDDLIGSLKQRQNFIKTLCLGRRGAPAAFTSTIVKLVVISKVDYGSFIYGSPKKCLLKQLDTTLNAILGRALDLASSSHGDVTPMIKLSCSTKSDFVIHRIGKQIMKIEINLQVAHIDIE
ncbi:hypothetical protein QYM36_012738, partial [Artemia franciscana]